MSESAFVVAGANIGELPDAPKYNIKAVCSETGIRPVTLRAWERRYKLLEPHRTRSNYRLYSERDVAVLRWLKGRVDSGLPISTAATELAELRRTGTWPETAPALPPAGPAPSQALPPADYAMQLYTALVAHSENTAAAVLAEAHAVYDIKTICLEVMAPCLVSIGDAWSQGRIRITTEHFASNFLRGRLMALFQAQPLPRSAARILVGCAPHELHDIASLILALLLRREGYRVEFLGQDVHAGDLVEYARFERPNLICLSAGSELAARELTVVFNGLANMRPRPKFGFGGRIFNQKPALREATPGVFLGETLGEALLNVRRTLNS
ncbi:MAG: MerR family transcriptional regulator [Anaerolineales bacterium]|nr:MerR family transcriptional regulator [Anaerolineales bacterium]